MAWCGGDCTCLPSAPRPPCGRGRGRAFGEDPGNFCLPKILRWEVPKLFARPSVLFLARGSCPALKALETTTTIIVTPAGGLISGSSKELLVSTNDPRVLVTSDHPSSVSFPHLPLPLASVCIAMAGEAVEAPWSSLQFPDQEAEAQGREEAHPGSCSG